MKINLKATLACITSAALLTACGAKKPARPAAPESLSDLQFMITLYPDYAPITCENFEKLVDEKFYDGLTFHRVVDDFMAQGGDPLGTGMGGSEQTIKGEFSANGVKNELSHTRGVISMARSMDMNSASSQFFICYDDSCTFLDGQYAAFGKVTEGMEVVDKFLEVERTVGGDNAISSPVTPIVMDTVVMVEDDKDGNPRALVTMREFLPEGGAENTDAESGADESKADESKAE